jgi:hypothetical protein
MTPLQLEGEMEPRTEAEMTAIHRARRVAAREKLRRQAEGMGRWGAAVTFVQVAFVYLLAIRLEGRESPTSMLAAGIVLLVAGNVAYVNARVDALLRLILEDPREG